MEKRELLGTFELLVLLAIQKLHGNAYGITIRRVVEDVRGTPVSAGAIYGTIGRLQQKGYVRSHLGKPTATRGGRAKSFVCITRSGKRSLEATFAILDRARTSHILS